MPPPGELKKLSLEELMAIEVTLVSRQPEKLHQAASAIQVITREDIRRAGVGTLPEALRLASNLIVAQVDARNWAITSRGFNQALANKLLVMIDGRTLYTPLYAGVFWDAQHVILDNVERIEVVSGPGGTLWGANAVNGVINIVTRNAKETHGVFVEAGAGTFLRDFASARVGGKAAEGIHWRAYAQRLDHNGTRYQEEEDPNAWGFTRGGLRSDLERGNHHFTFQAEASGGAFNQSPRRAPGLPAVPQGEVETNSQFAQGIWRRKFSPQEDLQAKLYVERNFRRIPASIEQELITTDMDFQHHFPLGSRQEFTWGAGFRLAEDDVENLGAPRLAFFPEERSLPLYSAFFQDQVHLLKGRVKLTGGIKAEHNDYSGLELMPSVRAGWSPSPEHTVWAAISRAVRSPSRIDADIHYEFPTPTGTPLILDGARDFSSEKLIAYEAGWRTRPLDRYSLSATAFIHRYDDLRLVEMADTTRLELTNGLRGDLVGVELSGECRATDRLRLRGGYSYSYSWREVKEGRVEYLRTGDLGNDPGYQVFLLGFLDLPRGFELNGSLRAIDALPKPPIPSYVGLDFGVVWKVRSWEVSVYGRNLLEEAHGEFGSSSDAESIPQEIPRSVTGRVAWRW